MSLLAVSKATRSSCGRWAFEQTASRYRCFGSRSIQAAGGSVFRNSQRACKPCLTSSFVDPVSRQSCSYYTVPSDRASASGQSTRRQVTTTIPTSQGAAIFRADVGVHHPEGGYVDHDDDIPSAPPPPSPPPPDFFDPKSAHESKSVTDLLRAILVLNVCRIDPIVANAQPLLDFSYALFGKSMTNFLLKATFFRHFCAGESSNEIKPVVARLRESGVESILDYAAESDDRSGVTTVASEKAKHDVHVPALYPNQPARTYTYDSEEQCDRHRDVFLDCIRAVRDVSPERGFAALKVTALGNPLLLERVSTALTEVRRLFERFDMNGNGVITAEEFEAGYRSTFVDADEKLPSLLASLDPDNTGRIDYITWSKRLTPSDLPNLVKSCKQVGPLTLATPSPEELALLEAMRSRAHALAEEAAAHGTRLLFDAEQTYYQPMIDNLVLELQEKYNCAAVTDIPIIFNTYQCYLKDAGRRMVLDIERARRFGYHFGAKLVRGAYMDSERKRAMEMGYESPIYETKEETHACYDQCVAYALQSFAKHRRFYGKEKNHLEIMCATHNQTSIEKTIALMDRLGIHSDAPTVHFAQLLGMADNLTYTLGKHEFRAYKYVPYGKVDEALPYLLRRAEENRGMLKGSSDGGGGEDNATKELKLLYGELRRRTIGL